MAKETDSELKANAARSIKGTVHTPDAHQLSSDKGLDSSEKSDESQLDSQAETDIPPETDSSAPLAD